MRIAIIGCGVAGVTAARAIRQNAAPEHEVTVYTDENHLYYPRPRLYEVLSGEKEPQEIYSYAPKWYEKLGIKVQLGKKIMRIDPANMKSHLKVTKANYRQSISKRSPRIRSTYSGHREEGILLFAPLKMPSL